MKAVLAHGKYIMGPEIEELEERLAAYVGVKSCICVASGTDALLIAPTAVHYPVPLYLQPAFAELGYTQGRFPVSESVAKSVMSLPMHPYLAEVELTRIVDSVFDAI
jgi:dTDP-4-amino-4,6-dideoxygalactose transaminase